MRHNLLQIYHKLGKSFDVGDIAARFSYVLIEIFTDVYAFFLHIFYIMQKFNALLTFWLWRWFAILI